jgi:hypothetical protein
VRGYSSVGLVQLCGRKSGGKCIEVVKELRENRVGRYQAEKIAKLCANATYGDKRFNTVRALIKMGVLGDAMIVNLVEFCGRDRKYLDAVEALMNEKVSPTFAITWKLREKCGNDPRAFRS